MTDKDLQILQLLDAAKPRSSDRTAEDFERAYSFHRARGRAFTNLPLYQTKRLVSSAPFDWSRWAFVDILKLADGLRLPKKPGLYGFFNLDTDSGPQERILYIGKSKCLSKRATKQHTKFLLALRNRASHVGCITVSDSIRSEAADRLITLAETALIQHWSPYLNIEENFFNFEVEPRMPSLARDLWD